MFCDHILPDLKIWLLNRRFLLVLEHCSILNAQSGTVFSLSDDKDVQLMGQHSLSCPLRLIIYHLTSSLNTYLGTAQLQNWLLHHPSY